MCSCSLFVLFVSQAQKSWFFNFDNNCAPMFPENSQNLLWSRNYFRLKLMFGIWNKRAMVITPHQRHQMSNTRFSMKKSIFLTVRSKEVVKTLSCSRIIQIYLILIQNIDFRWTSYFFRKFYLKMSKSADVTLETDFTMNTHVSS